MANVARVYIDGEIMPESYTGDEWQYTSIVRVRKALDAAGDFDEIHAVINSCGGDVMEGMGIHDLLLSYAKPVKTYVTGACCSIATIIFCAGSERLISPNSTFMVHMPWGFTGGNMDEIQEYLDQLKEFTDHMVSMYMAATGLSEEEVSELLSKDTYLSADECVAKGFATGILQPMSAKAVFRPTAEAPSKPHPKAAPQQDKKSIMATTLQSLKESWDSFFAKAKAELGTPPKAKDISLEDGQTLVVDTGESDEVAKGNPATIDGNPAPDGEHKSTDGETYVVENGAIKEVKPAEAQAQEESTDPVALAEENARLKAEIEQMKATQAANESVVATIQSDMQTVMALLGKKESKDVPTKPAGGTLPAPQARTTPTGESIKDKVAANLSASAK